MLTLCANNEDKGSCYDESAPRKYLELDHKALLCQHALDYIGSVQTIYAIGSEDALLHCHH